MKCDTILWPPNYPQLCTDNYHVLISEWPRGGTIVVLMRGRGQWCPTVLGVMKVPIEDNGRWSRSIVDWLKLDLYTTTSQLIGLEDKCSCDKSKVLGSISGRRVVNKHFQVWHRHPVLPGFRQFPSFDRFVTLLTFNILHNETVV